MRRALLLLLLAGGVALGCRPYSPRPYFAPVTGAPLGEIELDVGDATQALADVFRTDSFPVNQVELRDGYLETAWFDATSKQPADGRILGPGVVRIRAWVEPARTHTSRVTVETIYRPYADPSLSARELDRQVPPDHPTGKRVAQIVEELAKLYAGTTDPVPTARPRPAAEEGAE